MNYWTPDENVEAMVPFWGNVERPDNPTGVREAIGYGWPFIAAWTQLRVADDDTIRGGILWTDPWSGRDKSEWSWQNLTVTVPAVLPIFPAFPGLLLNTGVYGTVLWLLVSGLRLARATLRRRRGHCPTCAYDLRAAPSSTCPECGTPTKAATRKDSSSDRNPDKPLGTNAAAVGSIMLGAAAGVLALVSMYIGTVLKDEGGLPLEILGGIPVALLLGSFAGAVISPFHFVALGDTPARLVVRAVWLPTLAVTATSALLAGQAGFWNLIVASALSAVIAGLGLPRIIEPPPGICLTCDYQINDLPRCPECGTMKPAGATVAVSPRAPAAAILMTILSLVLLTAIVLACR